jgi:hypothetical protein
VRVFEDLGGAIVPVRELTELTAWVALLALVLLAAAGVLVGVARDSRSPAARAAFGSR